MNWTHDMPTVGGWYWTRSWPADPVLVWVREDLKYFYSTEEFGSLACAISLQPALVCEWAGPLVPPAGTAP